MTASHGLARQLFDEDAFYDTLDDVWVRLRALDALMAGDTFGGPACD